MELDTVICGDCLDVMDGMPQNCVDTVITDSPYGLSGEPDMAEVLTHWLAGDDYEHRGGGFMGKSWDSFVPGPSVWREIYRVMKPGGTLLAFGGTRTNDLLSIAIRLAGFQKFDEIDYYYGGLPPQMAWVTGQGFPKSLALDKAVDKYLGKDGEREVIAEYSDNGRKVPKHQNTHAAWEGNQTVKVTAPATEAAARWSGYGTGLKPAHEVILCFYKPREGSYANNALVWDVAGLWIDGGRIASNGNEPNERPNAANHNRTSSGHIPIKPKGKTSQEFITQGRWPSNFLLTHAPGCRRRGTRRVRGAGWDSAPGDNAVPPDSYFEGLDERRPRRGYADPDGLETVDDWECVEGCPVKALGEQTEETRASKPSRTGTAFLNDGLFMKGQNRELVKYDDNPIGNAARFFYQAKASRKERNLGCEDVYWRKDKSAPIGFVRIDRDEWEALPEKQRARGNIHCTVKPLGIVEYLCRLTRTPTGGVVFDPFCGTGTTALGAIRTGRHWLGCDNQPDYVYLANLRIEALKRETPQMELDL